jgi:hypothetical protein
MDAFEVKLYASVLPLLAFTPACQCNNKNPYISPGPANKTAMIKSTLHTILFLIFSLALNAQTIRLKGTIKDATTKQSIEAATLSIPDKKLFFPTNKQGAFNFSDAQITTADIIHISCIGYQTKKMSIPQLEKGGDVELQPLVVQLQEVIVGATEIRVGSKAKHYDLTGSIMPAMDAAMFMKSAAGKKGVIKSVGFFLTDGTHGNIHGDVTAPFRVRLFGVDSEGKPGKELTKEIIIAAASTNEQWFDINLAHLQIKNPRKGFFVSFSLLTTTYYQLRQGYLPQENLSNSADFATPRIGVTKREFSEHFSYTRNMDWYNGKWQEDQKSNFMIRATITPAAN